MTVSQKALSGGWWSKGLVGLGVLGAIWVGLTTPTSPFLPLGLAGLLFWALLCLSASQIALFLLGALVPSIYLLASEWEKWGWLLIVIYGLMGTFALLYFPQFRSRKVNWDKRLVLVTVAWGTYIWFSRNLSRVDTGMWDLKFLLVSGTALLPYGWFALVGPSLYRRQDQAYLSSGIVAGALVVALLFLLNLQPWSLELAAAEAWARTYSILGSFKNSVGLLWVVALAILLTWQTKRWWWIRNLGLLLFLISIAYCFSRSCYLALLIVILVYARSHLHRRWFYSLLLGGLIAFLLPEPVWERISLTWSAEGGLDPSLATRVVLWEASIKAFLTAPVWGIGLDQFTNYLLRSGSLAQIPGALASGYTYAYPHNYFLSLFALTGIWGGILGLGVFWQGYQRSNQQTKQGIPVGQTIQLGLIAYFVSSLFGETLFDPILLMTFLLLLAPLVPSHPYEDNS